MGRTDSLSSGEISLNNSPYNSAGESPNTSRDPSPNRTTKISPNATPVLRLKRANSYKKRSKKASSNLDIAIRRKQCNTRTRSKTTTDLIPDYETEFSRETKRISVCSADGSHIMVSSERKISPEQKQQKTDLNQDNKQTDPTKNQSTVRKKSWTSLLSLPSIRRSESTRSHRNKTVTPRMIKSRSFHIDIDTNDAPLFQATTLFVPGYDFKTKQSTPTLGRKQSTPILGRKQTTPTPGRKQSTPILHRKHTMSFFSRRISLGNITLNDGDKEMANSTPNLFRRGSKELLKKIDINIDDTESDRSPSQALIISSSDEEEEKRNKRLQQEQKNKNTDVDTIRDRQVKIEDELRKFREHHRTGSINCDIPSTITQGKVKSISGLFEDGTVYQKKKTVIIKDFKKYASNGTDLDNTYRKRVQSFETNFQRNSSSFDDKFKNFSAGRESGYASPTETSSIIEPHQGFLPNHYVDDFSDSWSNGQWRRSGSNDLYYDRITPNKQRVISTDLCVTEL